VDELHAHPIPHVEPLGAVFQPALDRRIENPGPGPLRGGAGDDPVELGADPVAQQARRRRLPRETLDFLGVVFFFRAVDRERLELVGAKRSGPARDRRFEQALGDDIGVAPVGGRRMRVLGHREPEVPHHALAREGRDVLTPAEQLDDGKREVGESERVQGAPLQQE